MGMSYGELERAMHVAMPASKCQWPFEYGMGLKTARAGLVTCGRFAQRNWAKPSNIK